MGVKKESVFLITGFLIFICVVGVMVYLWSKPNNTTPNKYEIIIDSLNKENQKLDSLFELESQKKIKTKILYQKIIIDKELDSLNRLKEKKENFNKEKISTEDTISPDSLRSILLKEFN